MLTQVTEHLDASVLGLVRLEYRLNRCTVRPRVSDEDRYLGNVWSRVAEQLVTGHAESL